MMMRAPKMYVNSKLSIYTQVQVIVAVGLKGEKLPSLATGDERTTREERFMEYHALMHE